MTVTWFATLVLVFCISTTTVAVKEYSIQERLAITHRIIKQVEAEDRKRAEQYASSASSAGSSGQDFLRRRTEEEASSHFVSGGPSVEQRVASKLAETFGGVDGGARVLVDKGSPSYFTETLAQGNTQPLQYYVSMANFDPKTARKYTTCFNVGDWYYQGPESTASGPPKTPTCPPTNGNPVSVCPCDVSAPNLNSQTTTSLSPPFHPPHDGRCSSIHPTKFRVGANVKKNTSGTPSGTPRTKQWQSTEPNG